MFKHNFKILGLETQHFNIYKILFSANLVVNSGELNTMSQVQICGHPLPRRGEEEGDEDLEEVEQVSQPQKRDIATNVPDVRSSPASPSSAQVGFSQKFLRLFKSL